VKIRGKEIFQAGQPRTEKNPYFLAQIRI